MQTIHLKSRAVIQLTGRDAVKFLQSLITNDATKISNLEYMYAFMLTPQGRFLYDFFIIKTDDSILLDCQEVEICQTDLKVYASSAPINNQSFADPRSPKMGFRTIGNILDANAHDSEYHALRIKLLVPDADFDFTYGRSLPLNFGEAPLSAIDFNKGCYVGQEVTARMNHRGGIHKKLYLLEWSGNPPRKEEELVINGKKVGIFLGVQQNLVLALLNIDEVEKLEKSEYIINDTHIRIP